MEQSQQLQPQQSAQSTQLVPQVQNQTAVQAQEQTATQLQEQQSQSEQAQSQTQEQPQEENAKKDKKGKKFYWMFYILSVFSLVLGAALMPFWSGKEVFWASWSSAFFNLILFCIIFIYITGFLVKQIIKEKKVAVKILTVFEAGFFFAIAIGSLLEQINTGVELVGPCTIVGAALWSRGFVYIVKAYLCKHDESDKYPLWMLIFSVGLVTLGTVMITKNDLFSATHIVWAVSVLLVIVAIIFLIVGLVNKPKVDKNMRKYTKEQKKLKQREKQLAKEQKKVNKSKKKTDRLAERIGGPINAEQGNTDSQAQTDSKPQN